MDIYFWHSLTFLENFHFTNKTFWVFWHCEIEAFQKQFLDAFFSLKGRRFIPLLFVVLFSDPVEMTNKKIMPSAKLAERVLTFAL